MQLKFLVLAVLFTGGVLVMNSFVWQGRKEPLTDEQESLVNFAKAVFPLMLLLLIFHWLVGLTAELVIAVLTAYTGVFVGADQVQWKRRTKPISGWIQSLVDVSYAFFPLLLAILVLQSFYGLTLALILTSATLYSALVVLLDRVFWRKRKAPVFGGQQVLVEYTRSFLPVLLFVLVIRSFIFEPFRIPSGSMMPTLLEGDFIFVNKYSYGLRLPVTETKVIGTGEPQRGDVIVFRLPSDPSINYIKRVIGLPGDTVVYERHRLTINGEKVDLTRGEDASWNVPLYVEDLDGRVHDILVVNPEFSTRDNTYRVPEGHYFVMGDNRDRSKDSRFIGAIPEEFLVGEAVRIWMHFVPWNMPVWERIGRKIQ